MASSESQKKPAQDFIEQLEAIRPLFKNEPVVDTAKASALHSPSDSKEDTLLVKNFDEVRADLRSKIAEGKKPLPEEQKRYVELSKKLELKNIPFINPPRRPQTNKFPKVLNTDNSKSRKQYNKYVEKIASQIFEESNQPVPISEWIQERKEKSALRKQTQSQQPMKSPDTPTTPEIATESVSKENLSHAQNLRNEIDELQNNIRTAELHKDDGALREYSQTLEIKKQALIDHKNKLDNKEVKKNEASETPASNNQPRTHQQKQERARQKRIEGTLGRLKREIEAAKNNNDQKTVDHIEGLRAEQLKRLRAVQEIRNKQGEYEDIKGEQEKLDTPEAKNTVKKIKKVQKGFDNVVEDIEKDAAADEQETSSMPGTPETLQPKKSDGLISHWTEDANGNRTVHRGEGASSKEETKDSSITEKNTPNTQQPPSPLAKAIENVQNKMNQQPTTEVTEVKVRGEKDFMDIWQQRKEQHSQKLGSLQGAEKILQQEKIAELGRRISRLDRQRFEHSIKSKSRLEKMSAETGRAFGKMKSWLKEPGNLKKLGNRLLFSAGIAVVTGLTGGAAGVALAGGAGAGVLRSMGAFAGQGIARNIADKYRKDYRQEMWNERKDFVKEHGHIADFIAGEKFVKDNREERKQTLTKYNNRLEDIRNRVIKKENRKKFWAGMAGGFLGGLSVRGAWDIVGSFGPDDVISSGAPETVPNPVPTAHENFPSPVIGEIIAPTEPSSDAMIRTGEGITHVLKRQLMDNPDLQQALGLSGNPSGGDLARIAKDFGYISEDGSDIRVFDGNHSAYELWTDAEGKAHITEFANGQTGDTHELGTSWTEQKNDLDTSEYTQGAHRTGTGEQVNFSAKELYPDIDFTEDLNPTIPEGDIESGTETGGLLFSHETVPGRVYSGHQMMPGVFDAKFNNMMGDVHVNELFEKNGIPFTQHNFETMGFRYDPDSPTAPFKNIYDNDPNARYNWKDIYERVNFDEIRERFPHLDPSYIEPTADVLDQGIETAVSPEVLDRESIAGMEVLYLEDGIKIEPVEYHFDGEMDTGDFSGREQRLLERGEGDGYKAILSLNNLDFFYNMRVIELKNGQYALEMIGKAGTGADAEVMAKHQMMAVMKVFGMPGRAEYFDGVEKMAGVNGYMSRAFTPISEEQVKFIQGSYNQLERVINQ